MSDTTTTTTTTPAGKPRDVRQVQCWPGGGTVFYSGMPSAPAGSADELQIHPAGHGPDNDGRPATADERRAVDVQLIALRYQDREIYCCDSSLVGALLELGGEGGELAESFTWDQVVNLRPDPSDWTLEQCREWIEDNQGADRYPDPNPWGMSRAELIRQAHGDDIADELDEVGYLNDIDHGDDTRTLSDDARAVATASDDAIREKLVEDMDDETVDGLDDWREHVRDTAEDQDVYQWFRVSDWLAERLERIGEPVLRNDYGDWWGRTCCGQDLIMDGTLQKVAESVERELDRLIPGRGK